MILVFGGSGQLGREWTEFLKEKDTSFKSYSSDEVDITLEEEIKRVIKRESPAIIVNCAGYTDVDRAEEEREKAALINESAVHDLAKLCKIHGVKLVHYSTDYVFAGKLTDKASHPDGYSVNHDFSPVNWYGVTKLGGEKAIRGIGGSHIIIRLSWLCGQYGSNFITTMLRLAENREQIKVVNDQWGSPTYAENVVLNSYNLFKQGAEGTFHITSNGVISWFELAKAIFELKNIDIDVQPVSSDQFPAKADRPTYSKLGIGKLREISGSEIWDWKYGLKRLLDQLKNR